MQSTTPVDCYHIPVKPECLATMNPTCGPTTCTTTVNSTSFTSWPTGKEATHVANPLIRYHRKEYTPREIQNNGPVVYATLVDSTSSTS